MHATQDLKCVDQRRDERCQPACRADQWVQATRKRAEKVHDFCPRITADNTESHGFKGVQTAWLVLSKAAASLRRAAYTATDLAARVGRLGRADGNTPLAEYEGVEGQVRNRVAPRSV